MASRRWTRHDFQYDESSSPSLSEWKLVSVFGGKVVMENSRGSVEWGLVRPNCDIVSEDHCGTKSATVELDPCWKYILGPLVTNLKIVVLRDNFVEIVENFVRLVLRKLDNPLRKSTDSQFSQNITGMTSLPDEEDSRSVDEQSLPSRDRISADNRMDCLESRTRVRRTSTSPFT